MLSRRELLIALPLTGLVGACASKDPAPSFPAFSFAGAPLLFNVADIATENTFSPLGTGHVEADFDVSPQVAFENWMGDRVQAAGSNGHMTVTLLDASAVEEYLPVTTGIEGAFRSEQGRKVTARLSARFRAKVTNGESGSEAESTITAEYFATMAKDVSFTERRQALYAISRELINEFDARAMAALRRDMRAFLG
ncbi:hypothetical protein [Zavarzinia aquatilis]|uniref:ABC-type transport auxiliary lipoprotein component domain-containing protein n=1 Tax=Zavarzinia aquatilis TaxID=2211142 RepID=A0A317EBE6_9PROT|nr:hypothetical protein [Zavarzinia aquatilis]PWR22623.1 hypothetical protein DKG74_12195 [Zavarzinia aquatilis]